MTRVKMARFDLVTKARLKLARCDWEPLRDALELLFKLAWVVFLFGLFVFAPPTIGKIYGTEWGVLTALLGYPIWSTLGVRPMPGLINGCICLAGYSVIHGATFLAALKLLLALLR